MPRMFVDRQHQPPRVTWQPMSLFCILLGGLLLIANAGCGSLLARFSDQSPPVFVPNPLDLPDAKADFVWSQVVDTVDDYFRVALEQPVQKSNGVVLDGRLETSYQIGASILEPWRKDTTSGFERLQSTLQSIRRRAIVIVRPSTTGYSLEVIVQKEIEDTDSSQWSNELSGNTRHDGTIVRQFGGELDGPRTLGWIPLGRDSSLEQRLLHEIHGRITQPDR